MLSNSRLLYKIPTWTGGNITGEGDQEAAVLGTARWKKMQEWGRSGWGIEAAIAISLPLGQFSFHGPSSITDPEEFRSRLALKIRVHASRTSAQIWPAMLQTAPSIPGPSCPLWTPCRGMGRWLTSHTSRQLLGYSSPVCFSSAVCWLLSPCSLQSEHLCIVKPNQRGELNIHISKTECLHNEGLSFVSVLGQPPLCLDSGIWSVIITNVNWLFQGLN